MSSPGIRARHMAEVLSAELPEASVTLAIPQLSSAAGDPASRAYDVVNYTTSGLPKLLFAHDIIVANDFPLAALPAFPFRTFVLDYYTIYFIEWTDLSHDVVRGS